MDFKGLKIPYIYILECTEESTLLFDSDNRIIYREHESGYWEITECSDCGNRVTFENSNGLTYEIEYNDNDEPRLLFWKDKSGVVIDNKTQEESNE